MKHEKHTTCRRNPYKVGPEQHYHLHSAAQLHGLRLLPLIAESPSFHFVLPTYVSNFLWVYTIILQVNL